MSKNNFFDDKLYRFVLFFVVLVLGSFAVVGIMRINSSLRDAVVTFFETGEDEIVDFEFKKLFKNTNGKRTQQMAWFTGIKMNKDSLLNPSQVLLGAYDSRANSNFRSILRLEDSLKTHLPLMQIYTAWGSRPENKFPVAEVKSILNLGSLPLITWEPWLNSFNAVQYPDIRNIKERSKHGLTDIANGFYDRYLRDWARDAKAAKVPIFLRFAHEMNDPFRYPWGPHNNSVDEYILAWQHVHSVFDSLGVENVIWVWSPHVSYEGYEAYYPGHEYVDYIATNILNYGEGMEWSNWYSFDKLFKFHYEKFALYQKPMMIAEFGTLEYGGSKSQWFSDALTNFPEKYPMVKALLFFHVENDNTAVLKTFDWYFIEDSSCVNVISKSINNWK